MIVYLLVNRTNLKCYVGQTIKNNLSKRWNKNLSNAKCNDHLTAAIKKYGAESFARHVLHRCDSQKDADDLERRWIAFLRTHDPRYGYNKQLGGVKWRGGHKLSARTKKKISVAAKARWAKVSPREKERFANAARLRWQRLTKEEKASIVLKMMQAKHGKTYGKQKNPWTTRPPMSESTKKKISRALRKYWTRRPRNGCCK
jgi:group I intron endonuclease